MNRQSAAFRSNNENLCRGFAWAKAQAEVYVRDGAAMGPCYEAALPGRDAFCMRDVSHQSVGAHCLGLAAHNRNMTEAFARAISASKDWCSWWEITSEGKPAPVDYTDDGDFWYNLPANFDVMDTASRLYDLTGDRGYLLSPAMENFFLRTIENYIPRWDRDGDGIVDRADGDGRRGIASYEESGTTGYRCAADALSLEYLAYLAAARMHAMKGDAGRAAACRREVDRLQAVFSDEWWNGEEQRFYEFRMKDGSFSPQRSDDNIMTPLRTGIIRDPRQIDGQIACLTASEPSMIVEIRSYLPTLLWKYRRDGDAMRVWLRMTAEDYPRREYPEVSFAAVEALFCGYMGISADADRSVLRTRSASADGEWAEAASFPLWGGSVDLRQDGRTKSTLTNRTGRALTWEAEFPTGVKTVLVPDGGTAACGERDADPRPRDLI